ncbi:glycoside hydrolase family 30 beta sandwich domain-containing protein, partial [Streptococcus pyogenes]
MVTIDPKDGRVTRNIEYYAFGHASRFVRRDARRVDSTGGSAELDHVAFTNPDGSTVLIVSNAGQQAQRFTVQAP